MQYIDPATGASYSIDSPRWCSDNGGYLNLTPGAGLKRGDVIVAVDGQAVDDPEAVGYRLGTRPLGGQSTLEVLRAGKKISAQIKLAAAPETPPREQIKIKGGSPFAGATVMNLSPAVIEELQAAKSVGVADAAENAAWWDLLKHGRDGEQSYSKRKHTWVEVRLERVRARLRDAVAEREGRAKRGCGPGTAVYARTNQGDAEPDED